MLLGATLAAAVGCSWGPPPLEEVELIREPVTLSPVPRSFSAGEPLCADSRIVGVCLLPGQGYAVSGRWTVLTPTGHEVQVVARAELVGGKEVTFASPSSTGSSLCVRPRRGGPLPADVERVRVTTSSPIVVQRLVWQSGCP